MTKTMLILAMALAGPAPARAAWLYCAARGATADGPVAVLTSLADIGPVTPPQLALLQTRLTAYVTAAEPGIGALQTKCAAPEDEVDAAAFSSRLLNNEARRVGWEHVVVLQPDDWLPASVGGGGILQP